MFHAARKRGRCPRRPPRTPPRARRRPPRKGDAGAAPHPQVRGGRRHGTDDSVAPPVRPESPGSEPRRCWQVPVCAGPGGGRAPKRGGSQSRRPVRGPSARLRSRPLRRTRATPRLPSLCPTHWPVELCAPGRAPGVSPASACGRKGPGGGAAPAWRGSAPRPGPPLQ